MSFFKKTKNVKDKPTLDKADKPKQKDKPQSFTEDLQANTDQLKQAFSYPTNNALKMRNLYLPFYEKHITLFYVEATVNTTIIDSHIIEPLLEGACSAF